MPTEPSLFELARVGDGLRSVEVTFATSRRSRERSPSSGRRLCSTWRRSPWCAAPSNDRSTTYATNVMGTVHLLDAARRTDGVRVVVNVTSDKCYENREWAWGYREDEPMGGHDPYSSSKACAELVTSAFRARPSRRRHRPAIASARAGNVIGGGDWAEDRLMPDVMGAAVDGGPRGSATPTRSGRGSTC